MLDWLISGVYKCTLEGEALNFIQEGRLTKETLRSAPVLSVPGLLNVPCSEGSIRPLLCCVQKLYTPQWLDLLGNVLTSGVLSEEADSRCQRYDYSISCISRFICSSVLYGRGREGDVSMPGCNAGLEGQRSAVCLASGVWQPIENTCILPQIRELLLQSQELDEDTVPTFVEQLSMVVQSQLQPQITNSSATISAIVDILNTIGDVTTSIDEKTMVGILQTVDIIVGDNARDSWSDLNTNQTGNASSLFLGSMESISRNLDGEFSISTGSILLNRTTFNNSFTADLNSSLVIDIPNTDFNNVFITTITFSTLTNVLPPRNGSFVINDTNQGVNASGVQNRINAAVVLVQLNETEQSQITNVTLSYDKLDTSLTQDP
ncbi:hypothetical protein CRUP_030268, partial [Coryphaenoides rupestris]